MNAVFGVNYRLSPNISLINEAHFISCSEIAMTLFGRHLLQISVRIPAILIEVSRGFSHFLQVVRNGIPN